MTERAIRARTDLLASGFRMDRAAPVLRSGRADATIAELLPDGAPLLRLVHPPSTRYVDSSGRIRANVDSRTPLEILGWEPGALFTNMDGHWLVCRQAGRVVPARRNSGEATIGADGRLRLARAALSMLGVELGAEATVLVLPDERAIAVCNPARILSGAPLSMLEKAEKHA
jgi:hypothetical protein